MVVISTVAIIWFMLCKIYPMASRVRDHDVKEVVAADSKLGVFHSMMLLIPATELAMPTSPAMRENTMKNPVAMFPNGKYIGK